MVHYLSLPPKKIELRVQHIFHHKCSKIPHENGHFSAKNSEDDVRFWSFVSEEDRPSVLQGADTDSDEDDKEDDNQQRSD